MWLPKDVLDAVDKAASVDYVDAARCKVWNDHRKAGELRLLTGWRWVARDGSDSRQGFKTETVCYRDAYYALVRHSAAPGLARRRLRLVA